MKITKVYYDNIRNKCCDTCDYDASYITDVDIYYDDNVTLSINIDTNEEELTLSESDLMIILGNTNSREEIIKELRNKMSHYESWNWIEARVYYKLSGQEPVYLIGTLNKNSKN